MKHNRRREEQQLDTALAGCETGQQHNTTQDNTRQDNTTQHNTTTTNHNKTGRQQAFRR
jgi:hypothetical protein